MEHLAQRLAVDDGGFVYTLLLVGWAFVLTHAGVVLIGILERVLGGALP